MQILDRTTRIDYNTVPLTAINLPENSFICMLTINVLLEASNPLTSFGIAKHVMKKLKNAPDALFASHLVDGRKTCVLAILVETAIGTLRAAHAVSVDQPLGFLVTNQGYELFSTSRDVKEFMYKLTN